MATSNPAAGSAAGECWTYLVDAWQRSVLFWDALRQRGDVYLDHREAGKPPVLQFASEMIVDGRTLDAPVNYALLCIRPPEDRPADPRKRPFVIVDPRAGHGPGIGGFKPDSQVGIARQGGHPVYFVTFFPEPVPGQTLRDVALAEAGFIEEVVRRHPEAEGKPCIIGNCQAGWAVAVLASVVPDLMGPIILNGAPLSYWSGVRGGHPMRYAGGLLGGKWLATMAGDLGAGRFDGANLVGNFENLNPSNTYWGKYDHLYANIDTEVPRFLDFERWWGGFFLMNAEEMDSIVTQLFIGNKLARGDIVGPEGRIDLKNIESPIVVFASFGDNITPPQQALNWIVDLYGTDEAIIEDDQTIVVLLHEDIGHLGIFVSGRVARKEHAELMGTLELIDRLGPGLYEMIIERKPAGDPYAALEPGDYTVRFEMRSIDDILSIDDGRDEEGLFQTVAGLSSFNDQWYRTFGGPWIRAMTSEASAGLLRDLHPLRWQRSAFSSRNPWLAPLASMAPAIRAGRRPVPDDNWYRRLERAMSAGIVDTLDLYRDARDRWGETYFHWLYGPLGLGRVFPPTWSPGDAVPSGTEAAPPELPPDLASRFESGDFVTAVVRMFLAAVESQRYIDRRSALIARELRKRGDLGDLSPAERRAMVDEQSALLRHDRDRALTALPTLLPTPEERARAVAIVQAVLMVDVEEINLEHPLVRKIGEILDLEIDKIAPMPV